MEEPREAQIEVMVEAVRGANEYGQWASQLYGGWGDDAALRNLFGSLLAALAADGYVVVRREQVEPFIEFAVEHDAAGAERALTAIRETR